jgi:hypothetical protein
MSIRAPEGGLSRPLDAAEKAYLHTSIVQWLHDAGIDDSELVEYAVLLASAPRYS